MVVQISRKAGWTAALFGVGFATIALAQAPNPKDAASVKAWQTKNNILEKTNNPQTGWQSIGADTPGVLMRGVLAPKDASGRAMIGLRIEFFAPQAGSLSELDSFLVDCAGNRIRQVTQAVFPEHNLGGAKKEQAIAETSADGAWGPTSDMAVLEGSIRAGCAATAQVAAAPAAASAGPPFNPQDQNAGNRWLVDQHIDRTLQANTLLGFGATGALFRTASSDTAHEMTASTPRYTFRQEYYGPKTVAGGKTSLSRSDDYDVNCRQRTFRIVATREYAAHNLAGEAVLVDESGKNAAFTPITSDPALNEAFNDICRGDSGGGGGGRGR